MKAQLFFLTLWQWTFQPIWIKKSQWASLKQFSTISHTSQTLHHLCYHILISRKICKTPQSVAIGWALCNLHTGDPLGLIHHCTCMRQPAHVLYVHQHVAGIFQDLNGLVVRNGPEAPAIDIQNLIPDLQKTERHWEIHQRPENSTRNKMKHNNDAKMEQKPHTTGTCL